MRWFILLLFLGCGQYDPVTSPLVQESQEQSTVTFVALGAKFFSNHYGANKDALIHESVYFGSQENVSKICQTSACGCNLNFRLVISDNKACGPCWAITHEIGHSAAKLLFDNWDKDHHIFGEWVKDHYEYRFPFKLCDTQGG